MRCTGSQSCFMGVCKVDFSDVKIVIGKVIDDHQQENAYIYGVFSCMLVCKLSKEATLDCLICGTWSKKTRCL